MHPTKRFSSRVDNYVKFRPGYPAAVLRLLQEECGLKHTAVVADIGCGTGKLAELFLEYGNLVFGIEPNPDMRAAGERYLSHYANFTSVNGRAEATTLPDECVDFITAGQAYHWFERQPARKEFQRLLRPNGWVVLIWNSRPEKASPLMAGLEKILDKYALKYKEVNQRSATDAQLEEDLGVRRLFTADFPNHQIFNWEGLRGRILSSSYSPEAGHPNHEPMLSALRNLFDTHQINSRIRFDYTTKVFYGQYAPKPSG